MATFDELRKQLRTPIQPNTIPNVPSFNEIRNTIRTETVQNNLQTIKANPTSKPQPLPIAPTPQPIQSNFIDSYLKPFQPSNNADVPIGAPFQVNPDNKPLPAVENLSFTPVKKYGHAITPDNKGLIMPGPVTRKEGPQYNNAPLEIVGETDNAYVYQMNGYLQTIPKSMVTDTPIKDVNEMNSRYKQIIEDTELALQQRRENEYAAKNPIDRFFTKATDIGFRQDDKTPSLGNPVADVASSLVGGIMGLATPTGGGNSLGGAMNTAGDIVEHGINKYGGKLINKLPNLAQKIVPKAIKEVGEGLVYSASKAPDYTGKDWAQNALEDATLGTGLGLLMDGAKDLPQVIKNAQLNKADNAKSKAIDSAYDALKTDMFPSQKTNTQTNLLKPYEPKPMVKPTTINKSLTLKNQGEQTAYKRLEDGITKAQNYFGTNELRTDEMAQFKNDTGIDLIKLADDYATQSGKSNQQVFNEIVDKSKYKRISGLADDKTYKALDTIVKQEPKKPIINIDGQKYTADIPKSIKPIDSKLKANELPIKPNAIAEPKTLPKQFEGKFDNQLGIVAKPFQNLSTKQTFAFESPEIEKTYKENKGIKQKSFYQKVKEGITETIEGFTRPIKTLPINRENAELYKELTRLPKLKSITGDDTVRILDDILSKDNIPDKSSFDIFSRKVLLDDLSEEAAKGNALPNKFTPEIVEKELKRVNDTISKSPWIQRSIDKRKSYWDTIKKDYVQAMDDIGIDVKDKFNKDNYFRHQVLEHANNKTYGTGQKLKSPTNRGFQKARSGEYTGDINTDYLQSEYEVMAQMKHDIEIAKTIKNIKDNYDISDQVKQIAKSNGLENWKEAIPEGYTTWQPQEGNTFYMANSIPENVADQLANNLVKEWNLSKDDVNKVLALGGKRKEYVVKQEIADTLSNLYKNKDTNIVSKISNEVQGQWKRWVLTRNPKSVIKYNIRNFTGDLDPVLTSNPTTLKKVPKATQELFKAFRNGEFSPELKSFYDKGGFQQLLTAQEITDINKLKPFKRFETKKGIDKIPVLAQGKKLLEGYENITTSTTNFREMIARYASYLDYLDQMKNSPNGLPKNYGASKPEVIQGIKSIEDRAFKLSNELLGAYDEVSEIGQVLRRHLIPFYSWMEVNMKRYNQIIKNAFTDTTTSQKVGNSLKLGVKMTPKVALKVGKLTLQLSAMTGVLAIWNNTMYSDLEETLPEDIRTNPHIILGKDKDGNTMYFSRLGALNDYLEWFGMGTVTQDVKDIIDGKKTIKEQALDMGKSPINKVASGISPFFKTPAELASGKKLYPDVFKPGNIRDKAQYAAQSLNLRTEYDKLAGNPTKPNYLLTSLKSALMYTSDPKEASYYNTLDAKYRWINKTQGEQATGFYQSEKSKALYNYKLALKYKDQKAAQKFLDKYMKLGGTTKGLNKSLSSMDPLYGLDKKEKEEFISSLTAKEREALNLARQYYEDVINK